MLLAGLLGWLEREQRDVVVYLREENRALKAQLVGRRLRLDDRQRRRLAVLGVMIGWDRQLSRKSVVAPEVVIPELLSIHAIEDRIVHMVRSTDERIDLPHFVAGLQGVIKIAKRDT